MQTDNWSPSAACSEFVSALRYEDIPAEVVDTLLKSIPFPQRGAQETGEEIERWKCSTCGFIHDGRMTPDFRCPICGQGADQFVKIEDATA